MLELLFILLYQLIVKIMAKNGPKDKDQMQFPTVFKFCSQDMEIYLEVLIEIRDSIRNLSALVENPEAIDPEDIRFLRHKMKSTFRILEDENFKQVLDDFTQSVLDNKPDSREKPLHDLKILCKDYEASVTSELEKHEDKA